MGTCFMFCIVLSVSAGAYSLYLYSRNVGWRHFLPQKADKFLHEVSIFDILVGTFIYRQFFDTVCAVIYPFL